MAPEPGFAEVEEFIFESDISEEAADEFRGCEPEVWAAVIGQGSLAGNPSSSNILLARIKKAKAVAAKGASESEGFTWTAAASEDTAGGGQEEGAAEGGGAPPTDDEVLNFCLANGVDERSVQELAEAPPQVQAAVMARGDLSSARNPSAALLARIRDAKKGAGNAAGGGGGGGDGGAAAADAADQQPLDPEEVENFILANDVDEKAAEAFRGAEAHVQRVVIDRGDLSSARNASAALLARMRDVKKGGGGKGGGSQKDGGSKGGGFGVVGGAAYGGGASYGGGCMGMGGAYSRGAYGGGACGGGPCGKGGWEPALGPKGGCCGKAMGKGGWEPALGPMGGGCYGGGGMMGSRKGYGAPQPSSAYGKRGGGGAGAGAGAAGGSAAASSSDVVWINVGQESQLVQQGLPTRAPVAVYQKGDTIFSSSAYILSDIFGDAVAKEVDIIHDADWEQFPEIGEVIKKKGRDDCFAVAVCANRGKWAVGIASGWKGRESAAKLAISVAIASDDPALAAKLSRTYPDFRALCGANGHGHGKGGGPSTACGKGGGAAGAGVLGWVTPRSRADYGGGGYGGGYSRAGYGKGGFGAPMAQMQATYSPEEPPEQATPQQKGKNARPNSSAEAPATHWLTITPDSKLMQEGLPETGPAISHDKAFQDAFSNSSNVLGELDPEGVNIEHDADWQIFPEVGEAMKQAGTEENCYAVGMSSTHGVWGVGIGAGWKARETSAKLALAVAIAQATGRVEEVCASYPDFAAVCAAAGLVDAPASKRRRYGGK